MKKTLFSLMALVMTLSLSTFSSCSSDDVNEFTAVTYLSWGSGEWTPVGVKTAANATTATPWKTYVEYNYPASEQATALDTKLVFTNDKKTTFSGIFADLGTVSYSVKDMTLTYANGEETVATIEVANMSTNEEKEATADFTITIPAKDKVYYLAMKRTKAAN